MLPRSESSPDDISPGSENKATFGVVGTDSRVLNHTIGVVMSISADFSRDPPILGASAPAVQGFEAKRRRRRAGNEAVCLGTTRGTYGSLSPRRKMCGVDGASVIFVVDGRFRGGGATPDG